MKLGYSKREGFLKEPSIDEVENILRSFHQQWLLHNEAAFQKGAINSAYITKRHSLADEQRQILLKFISSHSVVDLARQILGEDAQFLNTQLFFNPLNHLQNNYWHRDIQYTDLNQSQQQEILTSGESQVIHMRIAMADEPGLEVIPGSHNRWDTEDEWRVRMQLDGKIQSDPISSSEKISLRRGDLLIFDANMIHRGLYGKDRFAFDILFCKPLPHIMKYRTAETLPLVEELAIMECPEVF